MYVWNASYLLCFLQAKISHATQISVHRESCMYRWVHVFGTHGFDRFWTLVGWPHLTSLDVTGSTFLLHPEGFLMPREATGRPEQLLGVSEWHFMLYMEVQLDPTHGFHYLRGLVAVVSGLRKSPLVNMEVQLYFWQAFFEWCGACGWWTLGQY